VQHIENVNLILWQVDMGDKMVFTFGIGENVLSKLTEEDNNPDQDICEPPDQPILHLIISADSTEKAYLSGKITI